MRHKIAITENITQLMAAFTSLETRALGVPGMGLIHGFTGAGKTTALTWLVNQKNGIYVRSQASWTPSSMLGAIMAELGASPLHRSADMVDHIVKFMAESGRPLFVDEADHLLRNAVMIETLRDIHDLSSIPVFMVGMEGFEKKLVYRKQLARRISEWVEFEPASLKDAAVIAQTICEVGIADDLLAHLHETTNGSIGLMTVGLSQIEKAAKANNWRKVDLDKWGDKKLFLSKAPRAKIRGVSA